MSRHALSLRHLNLPLAAAALLATLVGCTQKEFAPPPNTKPVDPTVQTPAPAPTPLQAQVQATGDASPQTYLDASAAAAGNYAKIRDAVVTPLAKLVLSPATLHNVDVTSQSDFRTYLGLYHEGLINLARLGRQVDGTYPAETKKAFADYEQAVLAPCAADAQACDALRIVAGDARYTRVLLTLTQVLPLTPEQAWTYSFFAMDRVTPRLAVDDQRLFFTNAQRYLAALAKDGSPAALSKVKTAAARLNMILTSVGNQGPAVDGFYDQANLWTRANAGAGSDLVHNAFRDALWSLMVQRGPYNSDGTISSSYAKWEGQALETFHTELIAPFQVESTDPHIHDACPKDDGNAACLARQAQAAQMARMWISYELTDPHAIDSHTTFVLDQVFRENISSDNALALLRDSHADFKRLLTVANAYVRLRMATMVFQTHQTLKSLLGDPEDYHDITKLREHLLAANTAEDPSWGTFVHKINILHDVVNSYSTTQYLYLPPDLQATFETTFGQLDRDIKWLATYPNMLPVLYYISQSNLSQSFAMLWFSVTIDSDAIFNFLFQGQLIGWFNFTNSMADYSTLSSPEVVLAFRNALASEVFSDYGISPSAFLLTALDRLTATSITGLDTANASLFRSLFQGPKYNTNFSSSETDVFQRTLAFCDGKNEPEIMEVGDLSENLVGFQDDLTNSNSNAAFYWLPMKGADGTSSRTIANYTDVLRTDELYPVDLVVQMRETYQKYLDQHHLTDPGLKEFDAKVEQYRTRVRKYMGYLYYASSRFEHCLNFVEGLSRQRRNQVMHYEQRYLQQAYRDYATLQKDPSQLEAINARYHHALPDYHTETRDQFAIDANGTVTFTYGRLDFMARLKAYLLEGYTDPETGRKLAAIAPKMIITVPANPMKDNHIKYNWVADRSQEITIQLQPGAGEKEFLHNAFQQFYNETTSLGEATTWQVRPYGNWWGPENSSGYFGLMGWSGRLMIQGAMMKFGRTEIYDYGKPGCRPDLPNEDLNAKCKTVAQFTAADALASQQHVLDTINLTPDDVAVLGLSGTESVYGDLYGWQHTFFYMPTFQAYGVLDPYMYMASQKALGYLLSFPGTVHSDDYSPPPRNGFLERAKDYYQAFGSHHEGNLLTVRASMDDDLKSLYQGYVDREFAPQREIEALAAEEQQHGPQLYQLQLQINKPGYVLPLLSGIETPSNVLEGAFDRQTDFLFKKVQSAAP